VSLHHNLGNGRHADVVWDYSVDEGSGADRHTVAAIAAGEVGKAWQQHFIDQVSGAISYTGGSYLDLDSLDGTGGVFGPFSGLPVNGGTTPGTVAPQNAVLAHKICAHNRRQRNGRCFIPGLSEAGVDNFGRIDAGIQTGWRTKLNDFLNALNGTGDPVSGADTAIRVVHVTGHADPEGPGKPPRPNAWSSSDVTDIQIDGLIATQRRRNRG
jgi:hypothetical protein